MITQVYPISSFTIIISVIAWLCISLSLCFSFTIYAEKGLTAWEDIYARSLVGSILSYAAMMVRNTSPFDLPTHIRNKLFVMQTSFMVAFGLIMVGLQNLSMITVTAILLAYFTFSDKFFGVNVIFVGASICGLVILANPFGILVPDVNQMLPIIGMSVAILLISLGRHL